jgi:hypothetical protein
MPTYKVLNPRGIEAGTRVVRIEVEGQEDVLGFDGDVLTLTLAQASSLEEHGFLEKVT